MRSFDSRDPPPRRERWRWLFTLSLSAVAASACDPEPPPDGGSASERAAGVTVRDSAGVRIVKNHAPRFPEGRFWTIDPEPEILLGGHEMAGGAFGDSAHLVWKVAGVAKLSDGRVAVLSGGLGKVFLFEPSGTFTKAMGGVGDGPGEFRGARRLRVLPGDTIVVWDEWFRPASYFDSAGRLLKQRFIDLGRMIEQVGGRADAESGMTPLMDGSFIVFARGEKFGESKGRPVTKPGEAVRRYVGYGLEFVRVDSDYETHSFGSWRRAEHLEVNITELEVRPLGARMPLAAVTFPITEGPRMVAGGIPPLIYIVGGEEGDIHQFSSRGELLRIIRLPPIEPVPVDEEEIKRSQDRFVETWVQAGAKESAVRRVLGPILKAASQRRHYSPVQKLALDREGYLWVLRGGRPPTWHVFDPEGRWLGVVTHPSEVDFPCTSTGTDYRCWIGKDDLLVVNENRGDLELSGVETIQGYRINGRD